MESSLDSSECVARTRRKSQKQVRNQKTRTALTVADVDHFRIRHGIMQWRTTPQERPLAAPQGPIDVDDS